MELTFLKLRKKYVISEKKCLNDNNSHPKLKARNSQYSGASLKLQNKNSQFLSLTISSKP